MEIVYEVYTSLQGCLRKLLLPRGEKKPMWAMRLFKLMP
jgi:hypothetical protein